MRNSLSRQRSRQTSVPADTRWRVFVRGGEAIVRSHYPTTSNGTPLEANLARPICARARSTTGACHSSVARRRHHLNTHPDPRSVDYVTRNIIPHTPVPFVVHGGSRHLG